VNFVDCGNPQKFGLPTCLPWKNKITNVGKICSSFQTSIGDVMEKEKTVEEILENTVKGYDCIIHELDSYERYGPDVAELPHDI
jgi:hypothetical protein